MIRLSLHNKILLTVISIILFFGATATVYVFFLTEDNLIQARQDGILVANFQKSEVVGELLAQSEHIVKAISEFSEVHEYLENEPDPQNAEILSLFEKFNIGDAYSSIYLMDVNGNTLVSTQESFVGENYSFRDYFFKALKGKPYIDLSIGVTSHELGYYFSYPVFSEEGAIIGVMVAKQKPEFVHKSLEENEKRNGSNEYIETWLVDEYGIIIYARDEDDELLYKSLGQLEESDLELIQEKKRFANIEIESLTYDVVQDNLDVVFKTQTFEIFDKFHNRDEILVVDRVKTYPFFVISEITSEGIKAS
ncbi:cache domain-containing protein, partial [Patescibacteria group bacterium]